MQNNSKLASSIKLALVGGAVASAMTMPAAIAEEAKQEVERIQVTGSRIIREGSIAPTPVTVITGDELLSTGVANIGEALNQLPALGSTYSLANSGRFIGTAGLNILDLRNMGTARTLVLVNGKRHVSSSAGTQSVDVNTIPSVWVDKVEIITGGASAIYGADAVTGVVNFILKDDIEGLEVSANKGYADDSDHSKERLSVSYGTSFDDSKGNVAIAVEYSGQDRLRALDREQTSTSFTNLPNFDQETNGGPDQILTPNAGYHAINNAGVFNLDGWKTFNPDGSVRDIYTGDNATYTKCANCDYFNLREYTDLQPEFERFNVNFKANYEINDDLNAYFEAKYVNSQSTDHGQPAFFFFNSFNTIKRDNAFIDDSLVALMDEQGVDSIRVNRMLDDLGQRIEDDTRETQRYVVGLEGIVFEEWDFEVYGIYGQTDLERINRNNLIRANYANALDSVLINGEAVCRDADARAEGCVPVDIMGNGNPSQAAIDYINTVSTGTSVIKQTVIGGTLTNSGILELPAGYVGLSTGVEYRKEESQVFEPDNAEGTFFNALGEDKGDFDVSEIFAEVTIPLLSELPAIEQLDLDLAVRYADYSSVGSATTWKAGLSWEVDDQLRVRATFAEAIRAPNISDLFGAESQNFYSVDDTCKSSELSQLEDATVRAANCAALGVPTDFDSDYDSASIEGVSGGNLELSPEESTSYTIGAIYQPEFVDGLSISVDYWDIEIDDAISAVGAQDIINRCVDAPGGINNEYCTLLTRDETTHQITSIKQYALNIAKLEATGIDFDIGYNFDAFDGEVRTSFIATKLIDRKDYSFQDEPDVFEQQAGTLGNAEWQANINLSYNIDNWTVLWRTRFVDEVSLYTDQELEKNPNPNSSMGYGEYFISDTAVSYDFDSGVSLKIGVDNLFDKDLPFGTTGTGAGSASYDNVGRFFHATVSYVM
ncbi:TonB-dependent receptor domain-containing protein [Shewanella gelidii]|uniref:TonB-dependent receptor n=1 Tax=Shewanella gelidii TaxID=1642821 RepID=A0A917NB34_9GAMM|nr:TonB-dependent receptor [Shewanella gelidii]MCL1098349.1 TonB-dependent receptor [Shewanella gelidii]GGI84556.1 TonB-dependent receptor [Shewanella gelidii]